MKLRFVKVEIVKVEKLRWSERIWSYCMDVWGGQALCEQQSLAMIRCQDS